MFRAVASVFLPLPFNKTVAAPVHRVLARRHAGSVNAGQTTTKFCIKMTSDTKNNGGLCPGTQDNWLKIKFKTESCGGCGMNQVEEIHQKNDNDRETYKCGTSVRTYTTPTGNAAYTGKLDLSKGPDKYFDATKGGAVCVTARATNGCNPWQITQIVYNISTADC